MKDEKWYYLLEEIERKFGIEEKKTEEIPERRTTIETVIFKGASGRMKIERVTRPVILEKKVKFSKRAGSDSKEKYVYSEDEKIHRVTLYAWKEDESKWVEIDFRKLTG